MKRLLLLFFSGLMMPMIFAQTNDLPMVVAHRGCWLDKVVPENSLAGVAMARRYGYPAIECDVRYTSDSVMVLMHDGTINRTMRNASDYSEIKEPVKTSDLTFEELRSNYVLASEKPEFRTPIPTLQEMLEACKEYQIIPMLHSDVYESYVLAQKILGDNWICFNSTDSFCMAARKISNCLILLDPGWDSAENVIKRLNAIGGRCGTSSMKRDLLNEDFCLTLRKNGHEVQSSIFPTPHEVQAIHNGASIILSDFCLLLNDSYTPFDQWNMTDGKLEKSYSIGRRWEKVEYGALTVKIRFKGALEIILNGRHYPINRTDESTEHIGIRIYDAAPDFRIIADEQTTISDLDVRVYKF